MSAADAAPVSAAEAKALFSSVAHTAALVLAVSGGPDSTALLWLAARWRRARKTGPKLVAVTVDHGLRRESASEARAVKRLARRLGVPHRTVRWQGKKPATRLQETARAARYRLLAAAARKAKARHILTAHTLDDQAETVLIRMSRGSGLAGLGAMAQVSPLPAGAISGKKPTLGRGPRAGTGCPQHMRPCDESGGERQIMLVRPLLDLAKARLLATLARAKIRFADDPSNRDPRFTRVRWRGVLPVLAREGLDARAFALLARRLRRAEAAIDTAVGVAAEQLSQRPWSDGGPISFDAEKFARLPAEVALRLLGHAIACAGDEGPVQLGKLETLYEALGRANAGVHGETFRFRRTLAGALVTLTGASLTVERAPARRTGPVRSALTTGRYDRPGTFKLG